MNHKIILLFMSLFISTIFFFSSFPVYADDHHKKDKGCNKLIDNDDDTDHHRKRKREHQKGDDHSGGSMKTIKNTVYQDECGTCHFAYQPELMPTASWIVLMKNIGDHFGETIELNDDSKKSITDYLNANSAGNSGTKRGTKITRSIKGQVPMRITQVPYIIDEHHDISPSVFNREAIGSFSNCIACHTMAENGIYDDDNVRIPK